MSEITRLFADLTAAAEDIHGIAVEGQHPTHTADIHKMLLAEVSKLVKRARRITIDIAASLP